MDWRQFEIDGKLFEWGQTFNDVFASFGKENLNRGRSLWKLHKVKSTGFLGLNGVSCEFYGPSFDRPIMSISFELTPMKIGFLQKPHTPYMKHLEGVLGKPDDVHINPLPNGSKYNKGYSYGQVIYAPHWWFGDYRIGLSVYGGTRNEDLGETAALLYIGWFNEKEAAEPYLDKFYKDEHKFSKDLKHLETFELDYDQSKVFRRHYELPDPSLAEKDEELRSAQLVLYHNNLFRTPSEISNSITANQLRLMYSDFSKQHVLANKFDCTTIDKGTDIEFRTILPARGGGGTEIKVGELTSHDKPKSGSLADLKDKLKELGFNLKMAEYYDD